MAKKAYYCVGGPLDGEYATTDDFYRSWHKPDSPYYTEGGMYGHLGAEYFQFNGASAAGCSMIWLHKSFLKKPIRPKDR